MTNQSLLIKHEAKICHLTLNKPEIHNAFDDKLIKELTLALEQAKRDPKVEIVVLAAHGKNFSAGADLNWMQRMASFSYEENVQDAHQLAHLLQTLDNFPKPTLALVQGAALGGAIGLIACCDFAIAAEDAYFCFSEVKLGLIPAVISPYVIRAIGERQARRYFLTAERFNANQALKLGLIHEISEAQKLTELGQFICQQLQANCPAALAQAKKLISAVNNSPLAPALLHYTCQELVQARLRDSTQLKLKNFLAKRR